MSILKNLNPFKAKTPKEYDAEFAGHNPNKKIKVYEDSECVVSVPEGTPKEEIDIIVQAVKGKVKKVM